MAAFDLPGCAGTYVSDECAMIDAAAATTATTRSQGTTEISPWSDWKENAFALA
jgi:hypothetical protein